MLYGLIWLGLFAGVAAQPEEEKDSSYTVEVVGISPVLGIGIERTRVAANIQTIEQADVEARGALSLPDLLNQKLGSVSLNDVTTSPFQQDLLFRGFTASPLLGLPQGVAVYQNGVRINEPFGDTVQFDLIPGFAIHTVQVIPGSNPVYGLNALGGALALQMKNGFSFQGTQAEARGGSFGRYTVSGQHGVQSGNWGAYVGLANTSEEGWRQQSNSGLTQIFADLAFRNNKWALGSSLTYADTDLNGNGPAPEGLLEVDRRAVFTFPDNTRNNLAFFQARGSYSLTEQLSLQGTAYHRSGRRRTLNGDESDLEVCEENSRPLGAPPTALCREGSNSAVVSLASGTFVTTAEAVGDGVFNRTDTEAEAYGVSLEGASTRSLFGLRNYFLLGMALDKSDVEFGRTTEIGTLIPGRTVRPTGILIGEFGLAPDDQFNLDLRSKNRFSAAYVSNTLSLTERLHFTLAGRYNRARLELADQLGTSLDGNHRFSRFNPAIGLSYQFSEQVTGYLSYGESNRFPTAAELSCADPEEPCRLPNAFISDPPLEQVASRSIETGAWGQLLASGDRVLEWSATLFGSRNSEDIIFVASPLLIGSGFFQNAGKTQRLGAELGLSGQMRRTAWYANYSLIKATFESGLILPSNARINDAANANGELIVEPGDRLPGIPLHSAKLGLSHALLEDWTVSLESILSSSRFLLGDQGNDQEPIAGYGILNLRSSYPINDRLEVFASVNNLLNQRYATFGVLAELELDLEEAPGIEGSRFVGPGAPRGLWGGLRVRF